MNETWRVIPGAEAYEVSDLGRVRSNKRREPRILSPGPRAGAYQMVNIYNGTERRARYVHQLVLLAFVGPRPADKPVTRHLDGNPENNALSNLAYGTHAENWDDRHAHGTRITTHCKRGHKRPADHPTNPKECGYCRSARLTARTDDAA